MGTEGGAEGKQERPGVQSLRVVRPGLTRACHAAPGARRLPAWTSKATWQSRC